ncbi:LppC family lipoprotein [Tamilnaduibacter salinus]|uniref:LppC family lipoprotein n=1 Tax=Tamilnaduibacter salinus TaxID=1484056 RepID=A0A2A2I4K4_9GAMM|nr:penicillin-binding protein activator [Tamilnaduibacter salinus]PAV26050.1 LppC family lipoprotein [Tamilnaduibacter salinus]
MTVRTFRTTTLTGLLCLLMLLSGCASVQDRSLERLTAASALESARDAGATPEALRTLLEQVSRLQSANRHSEARRILTSTVFDRANEAVQNQRTLLALRSARALEDSQWARALTAPLAPDHFTRYPADRQAAAARLQSDTASLAGLYVAAAQTRIAASATLARMSGEQSHNAIWQLLKRSRTESLSDASATALSNLQQGWLELALRLRNAGTGLDGQAQAVRDWQTNWPDHPARDTLPGELSLIVTLSAERPESIALALPQSGRLSEAGQAVRDGFLARFYTTPDEEKASVTIRIYDSADREFDALYQEMVQNDADLIVGPLSKPAVTTLAQQENLPVPVLALNYSESKTKGPANLYQFGLSAEDEAQQLAERLVMDGRPQAVALIPWGDWGDRVARALSDRIQTLDGTLLDIVRFDPRESLKDVVAKAFRVDVSRDRAITVERTIGMNVEFEPRRRQDIDAIVMVASPDTARQLKPTFAFYYGGDLPVYAPSTVYAGQPDANRDSDLNGVLFTDIPWVLDPPPAFQSQATDALRSVVRRQGRLFALGADAWRLAMEAHLLRNLPEAQVGGLTGTLTMNRDGRVQRRQQWAIFENGRPRALPELESETE